MDAVRLHARDNIAVAARHLDPGSVVQIDGRAVPLPDRILLGHKFAVEPIREGDAIHKFGQVIGFASRAIEIGQQVHTHNVSCDLFERDYAHASAIPEIHDPFAGTEVRSSFEGFLRPDGRVGTRNYLAIVSTVNCSSTVAKRIAAHFTPEVLRDFPHVDGVFAVAHGTGCGMAASGTDRNHLQRTLAGFARHPNVFAYILIGLGCEVNQSTDLVSLESLRKDGQPAFQFTIQGEGGTPTAVQTGIRAIQELLPRANTVERSTQPVQHLLLGTNCGGSDGNSGITANPALGVASDALIFRGGTSILGETTEIYGAEHLLTRRAISRAVGEKLVERIRWWEWYTGLFGAEINNNPSHGNKAGGLTTIYEKSLGAVAKGGTGPLIDVVRYAEPVRTPGLVVMDTPGFDPASVTGIVAGGANIVVFTTGRGSVFGCKPTPSIKVATNTPLFEHMVSDMDIDAGVILAGVPVETVGRTIYDAILDVASGTRTKSELHGMGEEEFVPWTIGPVL